MFSPVECLLEKRYVVIPFGDPHQLYAEWEKTWYAYTDEERRVEFFQHCPLVRDLRMQVYDELLPTLQQVAQFLQVDAVEQMIGGFDNGYELNDYDMLGGFINMDADYDQEIVFYSFSEEETNIVTVPPGHMVVYFQNVKRKINSNRKCFFSFHFTQHDWSQRNYNDMFFKHQGTLRNFSIVKRAGEVLDDYYAYGTNRELVIRNMELLLYICEEATPLYLYELDSDDEDISWIEPHSYMYQPYTIEELQLLKPRKIV